MWHEQFKTVVTKTITQTLLKCYFCYGNVFKILNKKVIIYIQFN